MGRGYSTNGGEEESVWILEVGWSDMDWIGLTQDRGQWRAIVITVTNLRVP
jgi:hypothetical protein